MMKLKATVLSAALLLPLLAACAGTTETTASAPSPTAPAPKPAAAQTDDGWKVFGHALTLTQILMRTAQSDDPDKAFDDVLAWPHISARVGEVFNMVLRHANGAEALNGPLGGRWFSI